MSLFLVTYKEIKFFNSYRSFITNLNGTLVHDRYYLGNKLYNPLKKITRFSLTDFGYVLSKPFEIESSLFTLSLV